jgi:NifU-like protein
MWQNHRVGFYPPKIAELFHDPQNVGHSGESDGAAKAVSFVCGSFVEISLLIGREDKCIDQASYRTNGCGYLIAAAESLTRKLKGKELKDLHGLSEPEIESVLFSGLVPFPPGRSHCRSLVSEAVRTAFADYRRSLIEEFQGEKPLVCTCFGITDETVRRVIIERRPKDADELAAYCNAGTGCGSCRMMIEEIIDGLRDTAE